MSLSELCFTACHFKQQEGHGSTAACRNLPYHTVDDRQNVIHERVGCRLSEASGVERDLLAEINADDRAFLDWVLLSPSLLLLCLYLSRLYCASVSNRYDGGGIIGAE